MAGHGPVIVTAAVVGRHSISLRDRPERGPPPTSSVADRPRADESDTEGHRQFVRDFTLRDLSACVRIDQHRLHEVAAHCDCKLPSIFHSHQIGSLSSLGNSWAPPLFKLHPNSMPGQSNQCGSSVSGLPDGSAFASECAETGDSEYKKPQVDEEADEPTSEVPIPAVH